MSKPVMQFVQAHPGYYLLMVDGDKDGRAESLWAEPVVAWLCATHEDSSPYDPAFMSPEPVGIDGTYNDARCVGVLYPSGAVVQPGNQTWKNLADFCESEYGRPLSVKGLARQ